MIVLINDVGSAHKINDSSFASAQLVKVIRFSGYRVATLSGLNVLCYRYQT